MARTYIPVQWWLTAQALKFVKIRVVDKRAAEPKYFAIVSLYDLWDRLKQYAPAHFPIAVNITDLFDILIYLLSPLRILTVNISTDKEIEGAEYIELNRHFSGAVEDRYRYVAYLGGIYLLSLVRDALFSRRKIGLRIDPNAEVVDVVQNTETNLKDLLLFFIAKSDQAEVFEDEIDKDNLPKSFLANADQWWALMLTCIEETNLGNGVFWKEVVSEIDSAETRGDPQVA